MTEPCSFHSGIEARLQAICGKMDEREKLVNEKIESIKRETVGQVVRAERLVESAKKEADIQIENIEKSIDTAKEEMDRRLDGMNHFQSQLNAQAVTYIPRAEFKLEIEKLINRILPLESGLSYRSGSKHWTDYIITVGISLVVMLIIHYLFKF